MNDWIREPKAVQQFTGDCTLSGQNVVWREKKYSELGGVYKYEEALKEFGKPEFSPQGFRDGQPAMGHYLH